MNKISNLRFFINLHICNKWRPKISNHFYIKLFIVVTYEIHVFFEGAQKEVFSSILKFENVNT
jgi:hypothetical protein